MTEAVMTDHVNLRLALTAALTVTSWAAGPVAAADQTPAAGQCIAIMLPTVQGVEGNATEVGASVRELFASFLKGPSMRVEMLEARLAVHALEEARQKSCGPVLALSLSRKRAGGGGGFISGVVRQAGYTAASSLPGGTVGSNVAREVARAASQAVADVASSTKAKDEIRLDYKLTSLAGKTELGPKNDKAKAAVDGEDLLTPLAQRVSEAIVAAVVK
jgi:hypothetical protein